MLWAFRLRWLLLLPALLFGVLVVLAVRDAGTQVHPPIFYTSVAATASNTNTSITGMPRAQVLTVINDDTTNEVFVDLDGVATTSSTKLNAQESYTFNFHGTNFFITAVGLICSSGETASVRLIALP